MHFAPVAHEFEISTDMRIHKISQVSLLCQFTHLKVLMENTDTVTFVHGPQGSGKSSMLDSLLKNYKRYVEQLTIILYIAKHYPVQTCFVDRLCRNL